MFEANFWKALVCLTAFLCTTVAAIQLQSPGVLWWYLLAGGVAITIMKDPKE